MGTMNSVAQPPEKTTKKQSMQALLRQQKALEKKVLRQKEMIAYLQEQLRLVAASQYGKRSERQSDDPQADLFNEAEELVALEEAAQPEGDTDTTSVKSHARRKSSGRQKLPEHLPRKTIEHDIPEADKVCACGCQKQRIGAEVSENLEYIPAKILVEHHVRHQYACPQCEEGVQTAEKPASLIPKSNVGVNLLAFIIVSKYQDSLPLYRLSKIFARQGIEISRNTLARWVIQCSITLEPLIRLMESQMRQAPVILMDETTLQVNKEPGKEASSKSYMWIRRGLSPSDEAHPHGCDITLYHYSPTRSGQVAVDLLAGYQGALMTDGYAGYNAAVAKYGLQHATCWAHARRKFIEAEKSLPKGKKSPAITAILTSIRQLYAIEKRLSVSTAAEKQLARQQDARPVLDKLRSNLEKKSTQVTPKSKFGEAIGYTLKYWSSLTTYLENGQLPIDNNGAENGIRPFVVGRKNWLFADTVKGAEASARIYSLIETAKANGHEPYEYLSRLFTRLPQAGTTAEQEALLPWNMELPKPPPE